MKIVGCDLHTHYQQIAMLDEETGELIERRLAGGPFKPSFGLSGASSRRAEAFPQLVCAFAPSTPTQPGEALPHVNSLSTQPPHNTVTLH